jgi:5-methylcytosine-specific restriction protein A
MALPHHLDRGDPEQAGAVFAQLVPDRMAKPVVGLLSHAIRHAHSIAPSSWSISLFESRIRLNVGQVEVCTLDKASLRVVVAGDLDKTSLPILAARIHPGPDPVYKAVPVPSHIIAIDLTSCCGLLESLFEPLNAYLSAAANRKRKSPFGRAFSMGVLVFLERATQSCLPSPGFLSTTDVMAAPRVSEEVATMPHYREGAIRQIQVNAYERDSRARRACIEHYGCSCVVCDISFATAYGPAFAGIVHVHHLRPLSEIGGDYIVDPIRDLRPVCPNCHAAIHSTNPPITPDELQAILRAKNGAC